MIYCSKNTNFALECIEFVLLWVKYLSISSAAICLNPLKIPNFNWDLDAHCLISQHCIISQHTYIINFSMVSERRRSINKLLFIHLWVVAARFSNLPISVFCSEQNLRNRESCCQFPSYQGSRPECLRRRTNCIRVLLDNPSGAGDDLFSEQEQDGPVNPLTMCPVESSKTEASNPLEKPSTADQSFKLASC